MVWGSRPNLCSAWGKRDDKDFPKDFEFILLWLYDCKRTKYFNEMVNIGMRLEEAVYEGRLTKEVGSSSNVKKFRSGFIKKK